MNYGEHGGYGERQNQDQRQLTTEATELTEKNKGKSEKDGRLISTDFGGLCAFVPLPLSAERKVTYHQTRFLQRTRRTQSKTKKGHLFFFCISSMVRR